MLKMKRLLLLLPLALFSFPVSVQAQQVNSYGVCMQYQEMYIPGGYDSYGNYISGRVRTQSYNVPCNQVSSGNWNPPAYQQPVYQQRQRVCNPAAGAAMGGGLAEALSGGRGYRYSSDYSRNYSRNGSSGSYNYSYRNYKSNGWSLFGAGMGALLFSC
jgi:hypothetical protein